MGGEPPRTFLAVYRGASADDAPLVAITDDPGLVRHVVDGILARPARVARDQAIAEIDRARRRALDRIAAELATT